MHLYIDDCRDFHGTDAVICRTGENGVLVARALVGHITVLYMDHDLGDGINGQQVLRQLMTPSVISPTARQPEPVLPPLVVLVTMNPVGRDAMAAILLDNGYVADGVDTYRRTT